MFKKKEEKRDWTLIMYIIRRKTQPNRTSNEAFVCFQHSSI